MASSSALSPSLTSRAARDSLRAELGVSDVSVRAMGNLASEGDRLVASGSHKLAAPQYERAAKMAVFLLGDIHPFVASVLGRLANALEAVGDIEKSKKAWQRAQRIYEAVRDDGAPDAVQKPPAKLPKVNAPTPYTKKLRPWPGKRKTSKETKPRWGSKRYLSLEGLYNEPSSRCAQGPRAGASRIGTATLDVLTPRTREACERLKVNPEHAQFRDMHSFFKPGRSYAEQSRLHERWMRRREAIFEDLRTEREVVELRLDSVKRSTLWQERSDIAKRERYEARWGTKRMHDLPGYAPKKLLPAGPSASSTNAPGAYARAIELARKHEIFCPLCGTLHDFHHERCRLCGSKVNWDKVMRESEKRMAAPISSEVIVSAYPRPSVHPVSLSTKRKLPRKRS